MATSTKRPLSLLQKNRTAIAPRNPLQKTMTAGTTQPGRRRSSEEGTRSASVSIVRKDSSSGSRAPSVGRFRNPRTERASGGTDARRSLVVDGHVGLCPKRTASKRLTLRRLSSGDGPSDFGLTDHVASPGESRCVPRVIQPNGHDE